MLVPANASDAIPRGALLTVAVKGVQHEGLSLGDGRAIHKSQKRRKVVIDTLDSFAGKRPAFVGPVVGGVEKAMARIGEPWSPLSNCQRFVAEVSGTPRRSKEATGVAAVVGGLLIVLGRLTVR